MYGYWARSAGSVAVGLPCCLRFNRCCGRVVAPSFVELSSFYGDVWKDENSTTARLREDWLRGDGTLARPQRSAAVGEQFRALLLGDAERGGIIDVEQDDDAAVRSPPGHCLRDPRIRDRAERDSGTVVAHRMGERVTGGEQHIRLRHQICGPIEYAVGQGIARPRKSERLQRNRDHEFAFIRPELGIVRDDHLRVGDLQALFAEANTRTP